jgi:hypothetical protein
MHSVDRTASGGVRPSSLAGRRVIDPGDPADRNEFRGREPLRTDALPGGAGCRVCTLQGQSFVLLPDAYRTWASQHAMRGQRIERDDRFPRANVKRSLSVCGFPPLGGTGVEPATARFTVWCSCH